MAFRFTIGAEQCSGLASQVHTASYFGVKVASVALSCIPRRAIQFHAWGSGFDSNFDGPLLRIMLPTSLSRGKLYAVGL